MTTYFWREQHIASFTAQAYLCNADASFKTADWSDWVCLSSKHRQKCVGKVVADHSEHPVL